MPMNFIAHGWAWRPLYRPDLDLRGQVPEPVACHEVSGRFPAKGPSMTMREGPSKRTRFPERFVERFHRGQTRLEIGIGLDQNHELHGWPQGFR